MSWLADFKIWMACSFVYAVEFGVDIDECKPTETELDFVLEHACFGGLIGASDSVFDRTRCGVGVLAFPFVVVLVHDIA